MAKVTKMRFSVFDDIVLLREVIRNNPYENRLKWVDVQRNVYNVTMKNFSLRTLREHVELLLKLFRENDANLRRSGSKEQYVEKEHLLREIQQLQTTKQKLSHEKSKKHNNLVLNGFLFQEQMPQNNEEAKSNDSNAKLNEIKVEDISSIPIVEENQQNSTEITDDVDQNLNITSSPSPPINDTETISLYPYYRKRRNRLFYLRAKQRRGYKMRKLELELEERNIALEERRIRLEEAKFQLEKMERQKRLQIEIEERLHRIEIEKQQHAINNMLIHKFINE